MNVMTSNPFLQWYAAGYRELIPVVPPDAPLSEGSYIAKNKAAHSRACQSRAARGADMAWPTRASGAAPCGARAVSKPVLMTIFADASLCPKTGAAGWGAWAIRDGWGKGRFMGGPFRRTIRNSTEAEICGLASAIHDLDRANALGEVEAFILQCDNLAALACVRRLPNAKWSRSADPRDAGLAMLRGKLKPIEEEAVEAIRQIALARPIWLRHVKGHVSGTGRNWVNQQCDDEARRHMLAMRLELAGAAA